MLSGMPVKSYEKVGIYTTPGVDVEGIVLVV